jgi:hypothetical protein
MTDPQWPCGQLSTGGSITLVRTIGAVVRGRRHGLDLVLSSARGAVPVGARSCAEIADWAAVAVQAVPVCGPPLHACRIRRLLSRVDAAASEIRRVLSAARCSPAARLDGGLAGPVAEHSPVLAADENQAGEPTTALPRP